ncbi:hypothetical protein [Tsukamurella soli]|uniref:hypothetical protein n=1 Tax=Tsukamurella soli TaxID=644556 RepID=UPI00360C5CEE
MAGAAILAAGSLRIAARRDLGAGLIPVGRGRPAAAAGLRSAPALAWRLHRTQVGAWVVGFLACGVAFGGMASAITGLASPGTADLVSRLGGGGTDLVDAFYGAIFSIMGMIAAVLAISLTIAPAGEETSGRAEYLLAGPVRRTSWFGSQSVLALLASAVVVAAGGVGASLVADRDLVLPALGVLPAVWLLAAVGALAAGLSARVTTVAWVALALCVLMLVADVLRLPSWVSRLSPFSHITAQPGQTLLTGAATAMVIATVVAMGLAVVAVTRRDVG